MRPPRLGPARHRKGEGRTGPRRERVHIRSPVSQLSTESSVLSTSPSMNESRLELDSSIDAGSAGERGSELRGLPFELLEPARDAAWAAYRQRHL